MKSVRYLIVSIISCCNLLGASIYSDSILISYFLEPSLERQIEFGKGKISPIWEYWHIYNLDRKILVPQIHGVGRTISGFDAIEDASLELRAAYGLNGLYLLMIITDDRYGYEEHKTLCNDFQWLDWRNDGVDMFFDPLLTYNYSVNKSLYYFLPGMRVTKSTVLFQYRISGQPPLPYLYVTRYNKKALSTYGLKLVGDFADSATFIRQKIFVYKSSKDSVSVERVQSDSLSRTLQWRIPYHYIGINKAEVEKTKKIFFTFGYSDMDGSCKDGFDNLRWTKSEPWSPLGEWGILTFGPKLTYYAAITSGISELPRFIIASTDYYTLQGNLIKNDFTKLLQNHPNVVVIREKATWQCVRFRKKLEIIDY